MKKTLSVLLLMSLVWLAQAKEFVVTDFGAIADTNFLSTKAIQIAIDQASIQGGIVIIPAGSFKSGTLYLKSNVTIKLEKSSNLFGSTQLKDYPENTPDYIFYRKESVKRALIYAEDCTNIAIEGEGTIDGRGASFWVPDGSKVDSYTVRPYLIWMIKCQNVRTEGVRLRNSALWMQHYLACDNVYIHNIDVFNHSNKNNDMIDIDGCHDVRISDCTGDSDDDGITLKSTSARANENVVIINCILSSHCNAIKMGTESNTGFKNIVISNIVVRPSKVSDKSIGGTPEGHTGIALETVDGGDLDGIVISKIRIDGVICPVFIRLGNRARPYFAGQKIEKPGCLRNIEISDVIATNASKIGCSITGLPGYPIENISFYNISMAFKGGGTKETLAKTVPEKEKAYPEYDMFDDLPAYGFFIRHAQNVRFSNIYLRTDSGDVRPALFLSDVNNSEFRNLKLESNETNECNILIDNSKDVLVSGSVIEGKSKCFVRLINDRTKKLVLQNNVLTNTNIVCDYGITSKSEVIESGNVSEK